MPLAQMFCPGDSWEVTEDKREGRSGAHGIHIGFIIPGVCGRGGMCHTFLGNFCLNIEKFLGSKTSRCYSLRH